MMMKNDEIIATPPGETIKEQLKQQHMSRKELAKKMCISDKELALLLEGKALLTTEIANKLEKTLGISAKFWNRLEEIYHRGERTPELCSGGESPHSKTARSFYF